MVQALLLRPGMNTATTDAALQSSFSSRSAQMQRDLTVAEHLPMVRRIAIRVLRRTHGQADLEELMAWGTTGLLEAMDRYEEGGEATLATYSYLRIRGAMLDGIGKIAPLSRKNYRHAAKEGDFHAIYAAEIEPEEIVDPRGGLSPEEFTARKELNAVLTKAIGTLPPQQQTLVMDHYFGNATLKDSGIALGISKSWASRAHAIALDSLREEMEAATVMAA